MPRKIHIKAGTVEAIGELNLTKVAHCIWEALPIKAQVNLWGEEIYFPIPVFSELESGTIQVSPGDLGYWPTGNAFCIFFGPTPISQKGEIRPASAVTVLGKVSGDAAIFRNVKDGSEITISRYGESDNT